MKTLHLYFFGFGLSLFLTLLAFGLADLHLRADHAFPPHGAMMALLSVLAAVQIFAQLIFFLHAADEPRPRFNLMALCFTLVVVSIVIGGTLWIMDNLAHTHEVLEKPFDGVVSPQTQHG